MKLSKVISTVLVAVSLSLVSMPAYAVGERGEKSVGVTAGYNTRNESAVAGLFFQYRVNRLLRLAPDVTYQFKHHDMDGLALNMNVHMPLSIIPSGLFTLYPLAGVNYTSWSFHKRGAGSPIVEGDDVSNRSNKLGVNLGAGLEVYATSNLKLFVEGKYTGAKNYSYGAVTVGIGYRF